MLFAFHKQLARKSRMAHRQQEGSAMLWVIMVSAAVLTLLYFQHDASELKLAHSKQAEIMADAQLVERQILEQIDCAQTTSHNPMGTPWCSGAAEMPIELWTATGTMVFLPSSGAKIRDWTVQAYCANSAVHVYAELLDSSGQPKPFPLNKTKLFDRTARLTHKIPVGPTPVGNLIHQTALLCNWGSNPTTETPGATGTIVYAISGAPSGSPCKSGDPNVTGQSAACPAGTKVVSGGVRCYNNVSSGTDADDAISESYPDFIANVWRGRCCNANQIHVFANCM